MLITVSSVTLQFRLPIFVVLFVCAAVVGPASADAQSLRGSSASLDRQNRAARQHDFTYLRRAGHVERFVDAGLLVPIGGNADYVLKDVSYAVGRPEVKLFVERLAAQYRRACGEQLVVTSLTRPIARQPGNASLRSVHPTGMALDLRRPTARACRDWLESTLLSLERRRVLEATLERNPPHYHVAIFPQDYLGYVSVLAGESEARLLASVSRPERHTVRRGETLWSISQRYGTTPAEIRRGNGLTSSTIHPGQVLAIP